MKRFSLYARYSGETQNPMSVADQLAKGRQWVAAQDGVVVAEFSDEAMTGAFDNRPGYQEMIEAGKAGQFDAVFAEGLDRLSRDPADMSMFYRIMNTRGIEIHTRQDGQLDQLKVSIIGYMAAKFREDLAIKVRRGQEFAVLNGRFVGAAPYGYEYSREVIGGKLIRHGLILVPEEVEIVRRIYREFAAGASAWEIARRLNKDGIKRHNGKPWRDTAIRGNRAKRSGILHNPIYMGVNLWGRQHKTYDYEAKKKGAALNEQNTWTTVPVPHLRIVDDELWEAVQAKIAEIDAQRAPKATNKGKKFGPANQRRPKYLLSRKLICGCCGNIMFVCANRIRCSAWMHGAGCDNSLPAKNHLIERRLLNGLSDQLLTEDVLGNIMASYEGQVSDKVKAIEAENTQRKREMARLERQRDNLIDNLANGLKMSAVESRLKKIETEIALLQGKGFRTAPRLLPVAEVIAKYRKLVEDLVGSLQRAPIKDAAISLIRPLLDKVVMTPHGKNYDCQLHANFSALFGGLFDEDPLKPIEI